MVSEVIEVSLKKSKFLLCSFKKKKTVRPSSEPGWLDGTLNGKSGLIPENYVEVLP